MSRSLEYLLGEVTVDGPDERQYIRVPFVQWPDGWFAVADENDGYIAYFKHEEDAWAFRLTLINARMNLGRCARRYAKAQHATRKRVRDRTSEELAMAEEAYLISRGWTFKLSTTGNEALWRDPSVDAAMATRLFRADAVMMQRAYDAAATAKKAKR